MTGIARKQGKLSVQPPRVSHLECMRAHIHMDNIEVSDSSLYLDFGYTVFNWCNDFVSVKV